MAYDSLCKKIIFYPAIFSGRLLKVCLPVNVNLSGSLEKYGKLICYVTRTGCQWRLVPPCYAPWQTIYWYFRKWTLEGVIETTHDRLRTALRKKKGKNESASVGIID